MSFLTFSFIFFFFFFFNDTATTEIYTLSLHDALPIHLPPDAWTWPSGPYVESENPVLHSDERGKEKGGAPGLLTPIVHARGYTRITIRQEVGNKALLGRYSTGSRSSFGRAVPPRSDRR